MIGLDQQIVIDTLASGSMRRDSDAPSPLSRVEHNPEIAAASEARRATERRARNGRNGAAWRGYRVALKMCVNESPGLTHRDYARLLGINAHDVARCLWQLVDSHHLVSQTTTCDEGGAIISTRYYPKGAF